MTSSGIMLTPQQIFDKVARALLKQNARSTSDVEQKEGVGCRYRGANGCKCSIGHLIADEDYLPEMEGRGYKFTLIRDALQKSGVALEHVEEQKKPIQQLLLDLQTIHDFQPVFLWAHALDKLAKHNGLEGLSEEETRV